MSHNNKPFRTEMYAFLCWMVHYGMWDKYAYIVGYVDLDQ